MGDDDGRYPGWGLREHSTDGALHPAGPGGPFSGDGRTPIGPHRIGHLGPGTARTRSAFAGRTDSEAGRAASHHQPANALLLRFPFCRHLLSVRAADGLGALRWRCLRLEPEGNDSVQCLSDGRRATRNGIERRLAGATCWQEGYDGAGLGCDRNRLHLANAGFARRVSAFGETGDLRYWAGDGHVHSGWAVLDDGPHCEGASRAVHGGLDPGPGFGQRPGVGGRRHTPRCGVGPFRLGSGGLCAGFRGGGGGIAGDNRPLGPSGCKKVPN